MKTIRIIAAALLAALCITGCKKDAVSSDGTVVLKATVEPLTKVSVLANAEGTKLSTIWEVGDMIWLADDKTESHGQTGEAGAHLLYEGDVATGGMSIIVKYHPNPGSTQIFSTYVGNSSKSYIDGTGKTMIRPRYQFMSGRYGDACYLKASVPVTATSMVYHPFMSILEFTVSNPAIKRTEIVVNDFESIFPGEFDYNVISDAIDVDYYVSRAVVYNDGVGTFYVPVMRDSVSNTGLSIEFYDDNDQLIGTASTHSSIEFTAGTATSMGDVSAHMKPYTPINYGTPGSAGSTITGSQIVNGGTI